VRDKVSMDSDRPDTGLLDALHAQAGLICLVGAGGKKTTLYRLAAIHPGRIGITSTVLTPPFPRTLATAQVITDKAAIVPAVIKAAAIQRAVAFALTSTKHQRLGGLQCSYVERIHAAAGFDVTLVKGDGARGRRIKAPGAGEPPIPQGAHTVIPVVSARAIGKRLTERIAHRVERITAVTGARPGEPITAEHVACLLASEHGSLKNVGRAVVVPLINMVDDAQREITAREAAKRALALSKRFDRVVLTCMRRLDPIVAVIER
jgi:probable selenium-dependent hydroxylase accessory protein YqeC